MAKCVLSQWPDKLQPLYWNSATVSGKQQKRRNGQKTAGRENRRGAAATSSGNYK